MTTTTPFDLFFTKGEDGSWTATARIDGDAVLHGRGLSGEDAEREAQLGILRYLSVRLASREALPRAVDALFTRRYG